jgi:hypothetical protein
MSAAVGDHSLQRQATPIASNKSLVVHTVRETKYFATNTGTVDTSKCLYQYTVGSFPYVNESKTEVSIAQ